jgi:hypothetical protein
LRKSWRKADWLAILLCHWLSSPAHADPAAFSQFLIGQHDLQTHADNLVTDQSDSLAKTPRVNTPTTLYIRSFEKPFEFSRPISAFVRRLSPDEDPAEVYLQSKLVPAWSEVLGVQSGCPSYPLSAPDSLEAAAGQVTVLADRVRELHLSGLGNRDRRTLARDFHRVLSLLAHPQPSDMSGRERRRLRRFLEALDHAQTAALHCAALQWASLLDESWLLALRNLLEQHPRANADLLLRRESDHGEIVFAGRANGRIFSDNALAVFDLGGDDFYGLEAPHDFSGSPQVLVDFAGNDQYQGSRPGAYAAGIGRIAVLQDRSGDDSYTGAAMVQGAALWGVGVLQDLDGDDEYLADSYAQGAALYGLGVLSDSRGNDRFTVGALGQGLGLQQGLGLLFEGGGDDEYRALGGKPSLYGTPGLVNAWAQGVGLGLRGIATGGVGVLLDGSGRDRYDAGNFAQGGAYYRGVGMLLELGNDSDTLRGSRYAQAWGAHGGVGYLLNAGGDDSYYTRHIANAALAWDYSLALFHDIAGDDRYDTGEFSLAASAHRSIAWFVDDAGADDYRGARPARWNEGPPNFSLFLDRDPRDDRLDGRTVSPGCHWGGEYGFAAWNPAGNPPGCEVRDN